MTQITDDPLAKAEPAVDTLMPTMKANILRARGALQRQAHAAEVKLKGLFVDDLFKKLNLTKYR